MRIWHSGACPTPHAVNGINGLIYAVSREQARMGHEVTLLVYDKPDEAALAFARGTGVKFLHLPSGWRSQAAEIRSLSPEALPDLVHMHSVFIPQQWTLARTLKKLSVPFVVTPNGGLSPHILARSRLKKAVYSSLIERKRFRMAAGISIVTPKERAEVLSFVGNYRGPVTWIPNTFEPDGLEALSWCPPTPQKIVYLGRFDVSHKGIDIILDLARRLTPIEFHLYGSEDKKSQATLNDLKKTCTSNVVLHPPVYGAEKAAVLASATLYLQMSRWEAFGISIAEAMYIGLPCVLASTLHIASVFEDDDLGLVVPPDPEAASDHIRHALTDPSQLQHWSKRAKEYARTHFLPREVANWFVEFYQNSLMERGPLTRGHTRSAGVSNGF